MISGMKRKPLLNHSLLSDSENLQPLPSSSSFLFTLYHAGLR
ncbi:unnamed protein product [Brugia timori]|uniref:Uncharacterized protein n=1 Tax=Brugia timori TaxID=42155 RepID=A0A0R3QYW9_9BILA|nr:unnamed protein product [Brugia timori]